MRESYLACGQGRRLATTTLAAHAGHRQDIQPTCSNKFAWMSLNRTKLQSGAEPSSLMIGCGGSLDEGEVRG
jgi:hypothetical protein